MWNPNVYIFMYMLKKNNSWTQSMDQRQQIASGRNEWTVLVLVEIN